MLMQIKGGAIKKGDVIVSCGFKTKFDVFEVIDIIYYQVGILNPEQNPLGALTVGQVGYVITNMKSAKDARVGDTFKLITTEVEPEEGF